MLEIRIANAVIRTLEDAINYLRQLSDHEELFIMDKKGNGFYHKIGNETEINLSAREKKLASRNIIIHNHPNGTSISFNDFCEAFETKTQEIIAVTKDKMYSLIIPKEMTQEQADRIATSYSSKKWIISLNGDQTIQEASNKIWLWVAKKEDKLNYSVVDLKNM